MFDDDLYSEENINELEESSLVELAVPESDIQAKTADVIISGENEETSDEGSTEVDDYHNNSPYSYDRPRGGRAQKRIRQLTREARSAQREVARLQDELDNIRQASNLENEIEDYQHDHYQSDDYTDELPSFDQSESDSLSENNDLDNGIPDLIESLDLKDDIDDNDVTDLHDNATLHDQDVYIYDDVVRAAAEVNYPDFANVVLDESIPFTRDIVDIALDAERPGEILYALAQEPSVVAYLSAINDREILSREIGRFEAALDIYHDANNGQKSYSSAPEPIEPVIGAGSNDARPMNKLTFKEYEQRRNRQLQGSGKSIY